MVSQKKTKNKGLVILMDLYRDTQRRDAYLLGTPPRSRMQSQERLYCIRQVEEDPDNCIPESLEGQMVELETRIPTL